MQFFSLLPSCVIKFFEHPLPPLVAALNISLLWITCQLLCTFLCLSFTRMFLIYKVFSMQSIFFLSLTFFQPEHFIQLDHEKRFQFVLTLNSILSTVCVLVLLGYTIGPEADFKKLNFLTNNLVWINPDRSFKIFFASLGGATAPQRFVLGFGALPQQVPSPIPCAPLDSSSTISPFLP